MKSRPTSSASLFLIFTLLASVVVPVHGAQTGRRDRRVAPVPAPSATPTPAPSRTPATGTIQTLPGTTPDASINQTPIAAPTPTRTPAQATGQTATPTASPTATPRTTGAPQTLEELRARIRAVTGQPEFASSQLAVKVASLDTGRVLYEENANKWMQPASNMKLYTVAAALDRFSPDYRFVTSVYAPHRADASGTVRGDLIVYGRGDPTFATRFNDDASGDYYRAVDELASRVAAAGVKRVEGDLVGDESYFAGGPLAPGWEWDDLQWWYGAEVSALSINDNSVDLTVKPGARVGDPCTINVGPATPLVTVVDRTTTAPRGTTRQLTVHRPLRQNVLEISGSMPLDDRGYTASVAVSHPALLFASMLRASLERRGVVITGGTRTVDARERQRAPLQVSSLIEIAVRQSPPLGVIAAQTLKPSQNLYTELLLRALGKANANADPRRTSEEAGIEVVRNFLRSAGIDGGKLLMVDGSGLSHRNLVTVDTTLQLLAYMNRHRYGVVFREALPVAGVDGTLRNRMKGTAAANNVRAKTGTHSSAISLSGYVFSAAGERLVFSLMINNPPRELSPSGSARNADPRTGFTDAVALLLASYAGRS